MSHCDRRTILSAIAAMSGALAVPALAVSGSGAPAKADGFLARKGLAVGIQVYTVDDLVRQDLAGTFARIAQIGYRSVELAGLHGYTARTLREAADGAGLAITSIHLGDSLIGSSQDDTDRLVEDLSILGTRAAVLPMFIFPRDVARMENEPFAAYLHRAARSQGTGLWERTADLLNARAAAFAPHGISLAYHNHNVEFEPIEGGPTGWDILMERTDPRLVRLEIDLGWVAAAGLDPAAFVSRYTGRVDKVHVKDILASTTPNFAFRQDPASVGAGMLDWDRVLPAAYAAGVRHFYVEQEPPYTVDRFVSLADSYRFLAG
ncbi:sugar phosphate isomerase/epimerase [Novosphingobium profundi]|uniref:sugar phosphate isomerase/epimerase family protein n=1 Tax=Novosphingobium profundi TaxID=1774954 RepID=UPI001BDA8537|nr:sugar phosphate isomerase/epimerase [Novosphingobium profundi]MBT0670133.1 sugar phosphate isomerase/epimerase [Novosphingobium profundi]